MKTNPHRDAQTQWTRVELIITAIIWNEMLKKAMCQGAQTFGNLVSSLYDILYLTPSFQCRVLAQMTETEGNSHHLVIYSLVCHSIHHHLTLRQNKHTHTHYSIFSRIVLKYSAVCDLRHSRLKSDLKMMKYLQEDRFCHQLIGHAVSDRSSEPVPVCFHTVGNTPRFHGDKGLLLENKIQHGTTHQIS